MFTFLWSLVSFILALGILVAVHEWGHFWVARRCGVKVERFSIGFGKALWRRTDKLGTEYVIAAIPLGGYVKMLDERVDQVAEQDLPHAFNRQHVLKRIAIIAAGPGVNFLFAIFALFLMYLIGLDTVKPLIGEIQKDSIANVSGLQSDVIIKAVGGRETPDWEAVNYELMSHIGNASMQIAFIQQDSDVIKSLTLNISDWEFDPEKVSALSSLGITPFRPEITTTLGLVAENSAAQAIGLAAGDKILRLDGTTMENWEQIVGYIAQRPEVNVTIDVQRDFASQRLSGVIGTKEQDGVALGYLGVSPTFAPWPEGLLFSHQYAVGEALSRATSKTWRLMTLSVEMIGKLLSGDVSVKNLSGPISIAQGAGMSASSGLVYFLSFLALISVNLGIINLLPLPVLDGGHLLYYFIELLSGRPVPDAVQEVGFKIGGVLLLLLMSIAIVNDITRL
ncbi:MAG: regulator of sigma E protease [Paraglaciecola sp.]|jgi:regulator of sigma E protease